MDKQEIDEIVESAGLDVNPTRERLEAIVRLLVPMASAVCAMFGFSIDPVLWTNFLLAGVALVSIGYAWWRHNRMTNAAMVGGAVTDAIKGGDDVDVKIVKEG